MSQILGFGFWVSGFRFRDSGSGFWVDRAVGEAEEEAPRHTKSGVSNTPPESKTKTPWYIRMVKQKNPGTKAFYSFTAAQFCEVVVHFTAVHCCKVVVLKDFCQVVILKADATPCSWRGGRGGRPAAP